ncbi:hypothetical protein BKA69DRAFT_1123174 [Paraphysoderma sedebokerense]|nr:hypothetical protein BKA69DRAFT_1123174 [Paraphysoderma sedebokerense]
MIALASNTFLAIICLSALVYFSNGLAIDKPIQNSAPLSAILSDTGIPQWTGNIVSSNQKFNVTFTCELAADFCEKSRNLIFKATDRISNTLNLITPISMNLFMYLPCGSREPTPACSEASFVAFAWPANFIEIKNAETNEVFSYPQALAKQLLDLTKYKSLQKSEFDIQAKFNALTAWWLNDGPPVFGNEYDLEMIATHEILHGFGFGSTFWVDDASTRTMVPDIKPSSDLTSFPGFRAPSIWDKYVQDVSSQTPIMNYWSQFKSLTDSYLNGRKATEAEVLQFLRTDVAAKNQGSLLYERATLNQTLAFKTRSNKNYFIETGFQPFRRGSSLAHINEQYYWTPDFIMTWASKPRSNMFLPVNFTSKIAETKAPQSGLGLGIVEILETLGYSTSQYTPPKQNLQVVGFESEGDGSKPVDNNGKPIDNGGNPSNRNGDTSGTNQSSSGKTVQSPIMLVLGLAAVLSSALLV